MSKETSDGLREVLTYLDERDAPTHWDVGDGHRYPMSVTERIAALSHPTPALDAAAVREACAKVADDYAQFRNEDGVLVHQRLCILAAEEVAAAIRALPLPEAPASVEAAGHWDSGAVDAVTRIIENSLQRHGISLSDMEGTLDDAMAILAALADHEITSKTVDDSGEAVGCQQEPVAWMYVSHTNGGTELAKVRWTPSWKEAEGGWTETPLYAQPDPIDPAFGGGVK